MILREFNLLALVLTPKGKPSDLKNYNNLNEVDTNNILSFINYTTTDKQIKDTKIGYIIRQIKGILFNRLFI